MLRIALTCLVFASPVAAQGETIWGQGRYVEYVVGTAPVVVSAPHGGDLRPAHVADRTYGVVAQDRRTQETAREFCDRFAAVTGRRPHLIVSHLHRTKLDPNRDVVEAAQGDPTAIQAWNDFHGFCAQARAAVEQTWGRGIYIDMHGHGHPEGWVELGYVLSASTLALGDAQLDQAQYRDASSIRALANRPGIWFPAVLRGTGSLGAHLQTGGINTVPSPVNPDPAGGNYYSGGFNTQRYGSRDGGTVDGVQIELPFSIREHRQTRAPFIDRTVSWLTSVFSNHWGVTPSEAPLVTVETRDAVASETGGSAEFVVRRTGPTAQPLAVPFVVSGSAQAWLDYPPIPASVVIPAGASEAAVPITISDDALAEGDETIEIRLTGSRSIGAANRAEVLLLDDEDDPYFAVHWPFEEVSGAVTIDRSGNGHDGQLEQGPTRTLGRDGLAIAFDGVDDRVRVPDFAYAPLGDFTLSFWFRTSELGGSYRYVVSQAAFGVPNSLNVYFLQASGVLRTALTFANDITDTDVLDVGRDLRDGVWHHYALSADRDGLTGVWIDGALEAIAHFSGDAYDPSGDLILGGRSDLSPTRFFAGALDDVQIHARALSPAQVGALHSGLGADAAVHPGTGEDLVLVSGVGTAAPLTGGPREDVKHAIVGAPLTARFTSPGGTFHGRTAALVLDVFPTGLPPVIPGFPSLHVDFDMIVVTPAAPLTPAGDVFSVTVPAPLGGYSLMLQALALDLGAANGIFASSDGHEIRL